MNSADLSPEQAEKMHGSFFPLANYLCRLARRMEKRGFPPDDRLFQRASRATMKRDLFLSSYIT
jgi:hypothetical protein